MKMEQGEPALRGWLVTCRNILIEGRTTSSMEEDLREALALVDEVEVDGTKEVLRFCLPKVLYHVREKRFRAAGWILNLVHNMPLEQGGRRHWDVDYFLGGELVTFLEHYREISDARDIVLHVCKEIAGSPSLRDGKWS